MSECNCKENCECGVCPLGKEVRDCKTCPYCKDGVCNYPSGEQDKLLLTPKDIMNIGLTTPLRKGLFWADVGIRVAKAQHQEDKQHCERELKKLAGEIYIAQEEIRILQQKRLDRPEERERIADKIKADMPSITRYGALQYIRDLYLSLKGGVK